MKKAFLLFIFLAQSIILFAQWHQANGPYGGEATCVVASDSVVYISVGFPDINPNSVIYSSADTGKSWKQITSLNQWISNLTIMGNNLFTCADSSIYTYNINSRQWTKQSFGLYDDMNTVAFINNLLFVGGFHSWVSADTGKTWNMLKSEPNNIRSFCTLDDTIFASAENGIYFSADTGKTWQIDSGFNYTSSSASILTVLGDTLFAYYSNSLYDTLYRSTNHGKSWKATNFNGRALCLLPLGNTLLAGTYSGVEKKADGGTTFINNWTPPSTYIYGLALFRNYLFAATYYGVFISPDNGSTWKAADKNINNAFMGSMAIQGNQILASFRPNVYSSSDGGINWSIVDSGTYDMADILLVRGGRIFLSTEGGNQIDCIDSGQVKVFEQPGNYTWFNGIASIGDTLIAGAYDGIYRSTDNGNSWIKLANSIIDAEGIIAIGDTVYAAASGYMSATTGFYRTIDYGTTWSLLPSTNGFYGYAFAKKDGYIFATNFTYQLLRSTDNWTTWQDATSGIQGDINTLKVSGNNIYAGTQSGLFVSGNNGQNWTDITGNIMPTHIASLLINGDSLYAGTSGGGIWIGSVSCLQPFTVSGAPSQELCRGSSITLTASGASNYKWLPGGQTDSVLTVARIDTTTTYTLTAISTGGCSAQASIEVDVLPQMQDIHIYGNTNISSFSQQIYTTFSIQNVKSYNWTVPQGWLILSGQGTDSITVTAGSASGNITVVVSDSCNSYTAKVQVSVTITGIVTLSGNNTINIFPNPTSEQLTFSSSQLTMCTIEITNLLGRTIITQTIPAQIKQATIDVSSLTAGVYFITLHSLNGNAVRKFVKE